MSAKIDDGWDETIEKAKQIYETQVVSSGEDHSKWIQNGKAWVKMTKQLYAD
jgi:hypothetical protein